MASLVLCGAATVVLVWGVGNNTVWLFLGRAAVMASFTTLYVYTPEVQPRLFNCDALHVNTLYVYTHEVPPCLFTYNCQDQTVMLCM